MKTSNKLLLSLVLALIFSSLVGLLIAKQNMIITEQNNEQVVGNGILTTKQILDTKLTHKQQLESTFTYEIDDSFQGIKVQADENLISEIQVKEEDGIQYVGFGPGSRSWRTNLKLIYGVQDLDSLSLDVQEFVAIDHDQALTLDYLRMDVKTSTKIDLDLDIETLELNCEGASNINFSGRAENILITTEEGAQVNASDLFCKNLEVYMSDHSNVQLASAENSTGLIKDHAWIKFNDSTSRTNSKIRVRDDANIK